MSRDPAQTVPAVAIPGLHGEEPYSGSIFERDFLFDDPFGLRSVAADAGVLFEAVLILDYSTIFDGGASENAADIHYRLLQAGLSLDTEPLLGLEDGEFFLGFVHVAGSGGSEDTGNFQVFSNIESPEFTAIYELWYQHEFLDERLRFKIGKVDANGEFAYVENGVEFIHSSPGFSPTILSFPSYPDPAVSLNAFAYPGLGTYLGFGIYDGATQAGLPTGARTFGLGSAGTFFEEPSDLFLICEAGLNFSMGDLPGRLGLGVWDHNGEFERFDGGSEDGASGLYAVFDQQLTDTNSEQNEGSRGVGMFAQYAYSDKAVSPVRQHVGFGLLWTGPLTEREHDVTGLMGSYVEFSDEPGAELVDDSELAIEYFYKIPVLPWVTLKPDLQYIANPGGTGLEDAWVGTLRTAIAF